ncbi:MAG: aminoglycoside phosphotransferase [Propionibacteriales bacterium]|nr:aminoglycoside phosphotransferase [Propionibacteriales bacterium]
MTVTEAFSQPLHDYIGQQRWFGGKGRRFRVTERTPFLWLSAEDERPAFRIELFAVVYDNGESDLYQVPLAYYDDAQEHLVHALIGAWTEPELGEVFVYDALHDHRATKHLLRGILDQREVEGLSFHRLDDVDTTIDAPSLLLPVEQSNSSLAYGEEALLKVFRKVAPGHNPDIEIHRELTLQKVEHVAELYGWITATWEGGHTADLAMLQQFLRTATDGWTLALTSVRDLYAEADLHADEVGGDFAAEAHRLGAATAAVHAYMAEGLGEVQWGHRQLEVLANDMRSRLDAAVEIVPELGRYAPALREAFDELAAFDASVRAHRIHGDLHLGQTLRTVKGWKLIDFEGEPAKPLAERLEPDSPVRDVAGMLRSFDYAAATLLVDHPHDQQIAFRAREWAQRNRAAFCEGYAEESGGDPRDQDVLIRTYETDKAVYEVVYESRNRPTWLPIPLAAIARLARSDRPEDTP